MKNHTITAILFSAGLLLSSFSVAQKMDNKKLDNVIRETGMMVEGENGAWQFLFGDRLIFCLTDESNNRMRIITPVVKQESLTDEEFKHCLTANFHTALDVKYALSDEVLWSVFIHPLKELSDDQVKDAINQVYQAARTFGTTYSSTDLIFPGSTDEEENDSDDEGAGEEKESEERKDKSEM